MENNDFLTTTELAEVLGISRIAVFKKIKKGEIRAIRKGRNFIIPKKELDEIRGHALSAKAKTEIETAVKKTVREYGETLKLLGQT